ncbi:threonine aldolase family protein [Halomarina ordinaria]|uniref:Threonine aldolase family protein n=1 Tax=Halomarina ordinaria TaxID=3033939 RepID=A0ABD5UEV7_9EURY|nr:GntG family PLP-dependent aldolase [Halomarina sp. PSRA2]
MIDLRSDTVTRPSDAMREAARDAAVGDDVHRGDPTVAELETRVADLLGKEAALYVPSGTMGNQIAVRVHADRGEELVCERECHIYKWELAGAAQLSGVQPRTVDGGARGALTPGAVREAYVAPSSHRPGTGLVALENTHNSRGGVALAPGELDAAAEAAHDLGVPVHLDGARVANAAVAHDVPLDRMVREMDSVMACLSKGLGAPVGSMLAGDAEFVERARRVRKLLGGGMRQAGVIAAPGLLALENVDRLAQDHENARVLADGLRDLSGLSVQSPETNIVLVRTEEPASAFIDRIAEVDVAASEFGEHTVRFVTHLDVSREDVETAVERVESVR